MKKLAETNNLLRVLESNRFYTLIFIDQGTLVSLEVTRERFRFSKKPEKGDSFSMFLDIDKDLGTAIYVYMLNNRILDGKI